MKTKYFLPAAATAMLFASGLAAQTEIFSEQGTFAENGDATANRHVIPVEAGMTLEVVVIGDNIDTTLNATLPDGETLYNDDYEGLNAGFMRTMQSGGALEVVASPLSSGQTGTYRVVARTLPPPGQISVGETVTGRLVEGSSGDRYELRGESGSRVAIDLKSYDFDAYLVLVDSDGDEMSDDDGGDQGRNSRLHYQFSEDETVTLTARGLDSSSTGSYELIVTELSNEVAARHEGTLEVGDTRGHDGTRYDRYEIDAKAGETLTIMLDSTAFDTVLYVSGPDGRNLARDDDGGDGTNSLAVVTPVEDGTHVIFVTALSESTGDYVLTIYR